MGLSRSAPVGSRMRSMRARLLAALVVSALLPAGASAVVLAGGASGRLQGGRHRHPAPHTPLSNLRLAMRHKMGARVDSIGDSTEPLAI